MVDGFSGGATMGVRTRRRDVVIQCIPHGVAECGRDGRHIQVDNGIFEERGHVTKLGYKYVCIES
jgi:hypothetical protein